MSVFKRIFRPGSGGQSKGISIVDTPTGRAPVRSPVNRQLIESEPNPESTFYPFILANETNAGPTEPKPSGTLPGVDDEGRIPPYEADDPGILNRLFGIVTPDE